MITVLATAAVLMLQQAAPVAASAAAAPPAPAATTVSPAVVAGKKPAADPNQVVCRTEAVIGTLFPKKTCATRKELAERAVEDQQATRQATAIRPYADPH
jgi:hypothetical protein